MTLSDFAYPETEFKDQLEALKARFNQSGWLTENWPEPLLGWLYTPIEPIPLLLVTPVGDKAIQPVFCIAPDEWVPDDNKLYAGYVDIPYLIRALQHGVLNNVSTALRIYLFSSQRTWHYSAARDEAQIIAQNGQMLDPSFLDSFSRKHPLKFKENEPPSQNVLDSNVRDLRDWLRKWENELGSAIGCTKLEIQRFLYTLCLSRVYAAITSPGEGPGVFPNACWDAGENIKRTPDSVFENWDSPERDLCQRIESCPAQWLPAKTQALDLLKRMTPQADESICLHLQKLIGEFVLLSNAKFFPDRFHLALCSDPELQSAWKKSITHPIRIQSALSGRDGLARDVIELDSENESPARFADWIDNLVNFWIQEIEKDLISAEDKKQIEVQLDWFTPMPQSMSRRQILAQYLRNGLATSLKIRPRDEFEKLRFQTILSALALKLMRRVPALAGIDENLSLCWLNDSAL